MQKLQAQSLAESYIALADFFFKLLMVISSFCDPCFTPILAEPLLIPCVILGYRTFNPELASGHVLSQAKLALCHSAA